MYGNNVSNLDQILSSLPCYLQSARVRGDVYNLLSQIPSLQPNCGNFTQNDGTTSTLLNLDGTIPIFYRGNQYNIPVEFWILATYPNAPPVCFVRPTAEMMVKPGHPHVTSDGYISIEYISTWRPSYSLIEMVAHMCSIFGNVPPVFRRPPHLPPVHPQQYNAKKEPPIAYGQVSPIPQAGSYSSPMSMSAYPANYSNNDFYSAGSPQADPNRNNGTLNSSQLANSPKIDPRERRLELQDKVTSKIQLRMTSVFADIREDIDLQFEHQLRLTQSKESVERGIESLEVLKRDLESTIETIEKQREELSSWLDEHETKESVDVDSILIASDPLSKQMIKTFAESQAIDDCLYFMDRALSNGQMDLSTFLREVRKLARKQFMSQALMQRIADAQRHKSSF